MKNLTNALLLTIALFAFLGAATAGGETTFKQGNNAYKSGAYEAAIEKYQSLLDKKKVSWQLYYNMGNAYYRIGDYTHAILAYEKASKLSADNTDIKHNLAVANSKILDKIESVDTFFLQRYLHTFRDTFASASWTTLFIILLFIAMGLMIFSLYLRNKKRQWCYYSAGFFGFLAMVSISVGIYRLQAETSSDTAIVVAQNIDLKTNLDPAAEVAFTLHEGTKVQILEYRDNAYRIRIADGREAWISESELSFIVP